MHIACTQENLLQGLNMVSHIAGNNVNLPVLGNVLLKTEAGSLHISSTNLEMSVNCTVRGKVEKEGEYSVPAKLLLSYVALLPSGKVELVLTEEGLEVRAGEQETVMKGLPASEFPLLPKLTKGAGFTVKATDFRRTLSQVVFAVSPSQSRPELGGVFCFFGDPSHQGMAGFVATDSYRLAERMMPYGGNGATVRAIVPSKALVEAGRILGAYKDELGMPEEAELSFTENQLVVTYGNVELISRLLEGNFPDYQAFIPQQFKTEIVVNRIELKKAVSAASLFSRQGIHDIHFTFDPAHGTCTIKSADQGTGKTKTTLKGKVTGEDNAVTLNYQYLNQGLDQIASDEVRIRQIDAMNPLLVVPEGSSEGYRYIVMPIRQ